MKGLILPSGDIMEFAQLYGQNLRLVYEQVKDTERFKVEVRGEDETGRKFLRDLGQYVMSDFEANLRRAADRFSPPIPIVKAKKNLARE